MKYEVTRTGPYGRLYSSKGLLQFHNENQSYLIVEFDDLDRARKYCRSFVRRYPQAICNIHETGKVAEFLESYRDESYWALEKENSLEWAEVNNKGEFVQKMAALVGMVFVSIPLIVLTHYLGTIGASLFWKILGGMAMSTVVTCIYVWFCARKC